MVVTKCVYFTDKEVEFILVVYNYKAITIQENSFLTPSMLMALNLYFNGFIQSTILLVNMIS